jgi:pyridoxine 5-phosphate synthase
VTVLLHVNIDHVATLRRLRDTPYPDLAGAARTCLDAGARGITMHLREDRRHVTDEDVRLVRPLVAGRGATFNLEMAATDEMLGIARALRPDVATLVAGAPRGADDRGRARRRRTGGLDRARRRGARRGRHPAEPLRAADPRQLEASARVGARMVELHTGEYCHARGRPAEAAAELARLRDGARRAGALGLAVAAGTGCTSTTSGRSPPSPRSRSSTSGTASSAAPSRSGWPAAVAEMLAAMARGRSGT